MDKRCRKIQNEVGLSRLPVVAMFDMVVLVVAVELDQLSHHLSAFGVGVMVVHPLEETIPVVLEAFSIAEELPDEVLERDPQRVQYFSLLG